MNTVYYHRYYLSTPNLFSLIGGRAEKRDRENRQEELASLLDQQREALAVDPGLGSGAGLDGSDSPTANSADLTDCKDLRVTR